jgi:hypothetical protein
MEKGEDNSCLLDQIHEIPPLVKSGQGLPARAPGRLALFGRWGDLCVSYDANSRP